MGERKESKEKVLHLSQERLEAEEVLLGKTSLYPPNSLKVGSDRKKSAGWAWNFALSSTIYLA